MKPAPFTYHDPRSTAEATDLLARLDNSRLLAGGQSLMPMMNFRYSMPDDVIDLNNIGELSYIRAEGGLLHMGAMTRQRDIEFSPEIAAHCPILQEALSNVGHRQTRNRGTLGGSLCHFDPGAELVNITVLLDGVLHVAAKAGARDIAIDAFSAGYLTTQLSEGEMLAGVTLRLPTPRHGYGFAEFARRHGDFAVVACSALMLLDRRGRIEDVAISLSGMGHCPVRLRAIEQALQGEMPDAQAFNAAAEEAARLDAMEDSYINAAYRKHLARVIVFRVLKQAAQSAREKSK
ncbi:MAG TPA: xanthine dehydrogenase family protein subunit M [Herbaspirillum sp.]|jgi:carbon-monoxide dehydrogenase medium subunit